MQKPAALTVPASSHLLDEEKTAERIGPLSDDHSRDEASEDECSTAGSEDQAQERLLVVANRLPVTVRQDSNGDYHYTVSSGGLVSGLSGIRGFDMSWIGWPGAEVPEQDQPKVIEETGKRNCRPVFLDQLTIDLYYNGFANNVLWPLFHYIAPPIDTDVNERTTEEWHAYCKANELFADAIMEIYQDGDLVWVHDYHLMLVPRMLRDKKADVKVGWFLHTPFPSHEFFRMLSVRTEILTGLLSANLVGFHSYDYNRHFLNSCGALLGLETSAEGVDATPIGGVFAYCSTIPIGIEPSQFTEKLQQPSVIAAIQRLKEQFGEKKVLLGVDRLDYMKGIPHKLNGFDRFLEQNPEWVEQCVLVQLAVPSRTVVPEYQRLKSKVHEMVGRINAKRGKLASVPIHYLDKSLSFDQLVALYRVADVALITSLRDGMNLVAFEYIACQEEKFGTLILSEFAGAAQSLGAGSIRINPWALDEVAGAIKQALSMSSEERKSRHEYAFRHVHTHTSQAWAEAFIGALKDASDDCEEVCAAVPPILPYELVLDGLQGSKRALIVVDLLDSLVAAKSQRGLPVQKFKALMSLPGVLRQALITLGSHPNTTVIVTTTHMKKTAERLLAGIPVCVAAENGVFFRGKDGEWQQMVRDLDIDVTQMEWRTSVAETFEYFMERTPGSYIEEASSSLTWYWDDTHPDFGRQMARELLVHLWAGPLASSTADVVLGPRTVEVRPPNCSRAKLMEKILAAEFSNDDDPLPIDFIACIGNYPWRDEDVYQVFESLCQDGGRGFSQSFLPLSAASDTAISGEGCLSPKAAQLDKERGGGGKGPRTPADSQAVPRNPGLSLPLAVDGGVGVGGGDVSGSGKRDEGGGAQSVAVGSPGREEDGSSRNRGGTELGLPLETEVLSTSSGIPVGVETVVFKRKGGGGGGNSTTAAASSTQQPSFGLHHSSSPDLVDIDSSAGALQQQQPNAGGLPDSSSPMPPLSAAAAMQQSSSLRETLQTAEESPAQSVLTETAQKTGITSILTGPGATTAGGPPQTERVGGSETSEPVGVSAASVPSPVLTASRANHCSPSQLSQAEPQDKEREKERLQAETSASCLDGGGGGGGAAGGAVGASSGLQGEIVGIDVKKLGSGVGGQGGVAGTDSATPSGGGYVNVCMTETSVVRAITSDDCQLYTICVGVKMSKARYCLPNAVHAQSFIKALASKLPRPPAESYQMRVVLGLVPPQWGLQQQHVHYHAVSAALPEVSTAPGHLERGVTASFGVDKERESFGSVAGVSALTGGGGESALPFGGSAISSVDPTGMLRSVAPSPLPMVASDSQIYGSQQQQSNNLSSPVPATNTSCPSPLSQIPPMGGGPFAHLGGVGVQMFASTHSRTTTTGPDRATTSFQAAMVTAPTMFSQPRHGIPRGTSGYTAAASLGIPADSTVSGASSGIVPPPPLSLMDLSLDELRARPPPVAVLAEKRHARLQQQLQLQLQPPSNPHDSQQHGAQQTSLSVTKTVQTLGVGAAAGGAGSAGGSGAGSHPSPSMGVFNQGDALPPARLVAMGALKHPNLLQQGGRRGLRPQDGGVVPLPSPTGSTSGSVQAVRDEGNQLRGVHQQTQQQQERETAPSLQALPEQHPVTVPPEGGDRMQQPPSRSPAPSSVGSVEAAPSGVDLYIRSPPARRSVALPQTGPVVHQSAPSSGNGAAQQPAHTHFPTVPIGHLGLSGGMGYPQSSFGLISPVTMVTRAKPFRARTKGTSGERPEKDSRQRHPSFPHPHPHTLTVGNTQVLSSGTAHGPGFGSHLYSRLHRRDRDRGTRGDQGGEGKSVRERGHQQSKSVTLGESTVLPPRPPAGGGASGVAPSCEMREREADRERERREKVPSAGAGASGQHHTLHHFQNQSIGRLLQGGKEGNVTFATAAFGHQQPLYIHTGSGASGEASGRPVEGDRERERGAGGEGREATSRHPFPSASSSSWGAGPLSRVDTEGGPLSMSDTRSANPSVALGLSQASASSSSAQQQPAQLSSLEGGGGGRGASATLAPPDQHRQAGRGAMGTGVGSRTRPRWSTRASEDTMHSEALASQGSAVGFGVASQSPSVSADPIGFEASGEQVGGAGREGAGTGPPRVWEGQDKATGRPTLPVDIGGTGVPHSLPPTTTLQSSPSADQDEMHWSLTRGEVVPRQQQQQQPQLQSTLPPSMPPIYPQATGSTVLPSQSPPSDVPQPQYHQQTGASDDPLPWSGGAAPSMGSVAFPSFSTPIATDPTSGLPGGLGLDRGGGGGITVFQELGDGETAPHQQQQQQQQPRLPVGAQEDQSQVRNNTYPSWSTLFRPSPRAGAFFEGGAAGGVSQSGYSTMSPSALWGGETSHHAGMLDSRPSVAGHLAAAGQETKGWTDVPPYGMGMGRSHPREVSPAPGGVFRHPAAVSSSGGAGDSGGEGEPERGAQAIRRFSDVRRQVQEGGQMQTVPRFLQQNPMTASEYATPLPVQSTYNSASPYPIPASAAPSQPQPIPSPPLPSLPTHSFSSIVTSVQAQPSCSTQDGRIPSYHLSQQQQQQQQQQNERSAYPPAGPAPSAPSASSASHVVPTSPSGVLHTPPHAAGPPHVQMSPSLLPHLPPSTEPPLPPSSAAWPRKLSSSSPTAVVHHQGSHQRFSNPSVPLGGGVAGGMHTQGHPQSQPQPAAASGVQMPPLPRDPTAESGVGVPHPHPNRDRDTPTSRRVMVERDMDTLPPGAAISFAPPAPSVLATVPPGSFVSPHGGQDPSLWQQQQQQARRQSASASLPPMYAGSAPSASFESSAEPSGQQDLQGQGGGQAQTQSATSHEDLALAFGPSMSTETGAVHVPLSAGQRASQSSQRSGNANAHHPSSSGSPLLPPISRGVEVAQQQQQLPSDQHRARASSRDTPHSRMSTASASVQHAAPHAAVEAGRSALPPRGFSAAAMQHQQQQQQLDPRSGTASEGASSHSQPPSTQQAQAQQSHPPIGYSAPGMAVSMQQPPPLQEHQNPAQQIASPGARGKDREPPTVDLIQSDFRQTHAGISMQQQQQLGSPPRPTVRHPLMDHGAVAHPSAIQLAQQTQAVAAAVEQPHQQEPHSHHMSAVAAPPPPLQTQGSDNIHASGSRPTSPIDVQRQPLPLPLPQLPPAAPQPPLPPPPMQAQAHPPHAPHQHQPHHHPPPPSSHSQTETSPHGPSVATADAAFGLGASTSAFPVPSQQQQQQQTPSAHTASVSASARLPPVHPQSSPPSQMVPPRVPRVPQPDQLPRPQSSVTSAAALTHSSHTPPLPNSHSIPMLPPAAERDATLPIPPAGPHVPRQRTFANDILPTETISSRANTAPPPASSSSMHMQSPPPSIHQMHPVAGGEGESNIYLAEVPGQPGFYMQVRLVGQIASRPSPSVTHAQSYQGAPSSVAAAGAGVDQQSLYGDMDGVSVAQASEFADVGGAHRGQQPASATTTPARMRPTVSGATPQNQQQQQQAAVQMQTAHAAPLSYSSTQPPGFVQQQQPGHGPPQQAVGTVSHPTSQIVPPTQDSLTMLQPQHAPAPSPPQPQSLGILQLQQQQEQHNVHYAAPPPSARPPPHQYAPPSAHLPPTPVAPHAIPMQQQQTQSQPQPQPAPPHTPPQNPLTPPLVPVQQQQPLPLQHQPQPQAVHAAPLPHGQPQQTSIPPTPQAVQQQQQQQMHYAPQPQPPQPQFVQMASGPPATSVLSPSLPPSTVGAPSQEPSLPHPHLSLPPQPQQQTQAHPLPLVSTSHQTGQQGQGGGGGGPPHAYAPSSHLPSVELQHAPPATAFHVHMPPHQVAPPPQSMQQQPPEMQQIYQQQQQAEVPQMYQQQQQAEVPQMYQQQQALPQTTMDLQQPNPQQAMPPQPPQEPHLSQQHVASAEQQQQQQ
uniref:Uncharacterized protein n=1 Tax=Chromera velia CCMP2878 TaxID=1169474 RepID=A0A0G4I9Q1_9ALVE|eukprot:Cvel_12223.t1-p1 / transcript=Cvel_12223.t1 / gene=Cvel_12223 / organism=Chromera_velia_CCMP2878 / gene_product=Alpha,alpha-trehalose-phosphate synthase, putative / transcript_product=Alpha,alpha-trehalose-phosphate synthase, putative / location=Cvel_scaffold791:19037-37136(+) / protein_length=3858 / sequence_SO=supercontig / SO=protein_coding / is_pseudo=false